MSIKAGTRIVSRLKTTEQITTFINSPTWSIQELEAKQTPPPAIDIAKYNKLSGLTFDNDIGIQKQINFINQLHSYQDDDDDDMGLIRPKIQHRGDKLTFDELIRQINCQRQDNLKGETGVWDCMALPVLKSKNYYIVKEGLYK